MRIEFEKITDEYAYPISAKDVKGVLQASIPPEVLERIRRVHFGCNHKTTQEARIVARGTIFDIRVNFCLKNLRSPVLTEKQEWIKCITSFGGVIEDGKNSVLWSSDTARRYAIFLLLHEVAHIVYAQNQGIDWLRGGKGSPPEERWCNDFAREKTSHFS